MSDILRFIASIMSLHNRTHMEEAWGIKQVISEAPENTKIENVGINLSC